jgi:hypothetical protein
MLWATSDTQVDVRSFLTPPAWTRGFLQSPFPSRQCRPAVHHPLAESERIRQWLQSYDGFTSYDAFVAHQQQTGHRPMPFATGNPAVESWKQGSKQLVRSVIVCGESLVSDDPHGDNNNKLAFVSPKHAVPWATESSDAAVLANVQSPGQLDQHPHQLNEVGRPSWALLPSLPNNRYKLTADASWPSAVETEREVRNVNSEMAACHDGTEMRVLSETKNSKAVLFDWSIRRRQTGKTKKSSQCTFGRVSTSIKVDPPRHLGLLASRFLHDKYFAGLRARKLYLFHVELACSPLVSTGTAAASKYASPPGLSPATATVGLVSLRHPRHSLQHRGVYVSSRGGLRVAWPGEEGGQAVDLMTQTPHEQSQQGLTCSTMRLRQVSILLDLAEGVVTFATFPSTTNISGGGTGVGYVHVLLRDLSITPQVQSGVDHEPRLTWGWSADQSGLFPRLDTAEMSPSEPTFLGLEAWTPELVVDSPAGDQSNVMAVVREQRQHEAIAFQAELTRKTGECKKLSRRATYCTTPKLGSWDHQK